MKEYLALVLEAAKNFLTVHFEHIQWEHQVRHTFEIGKFQNKMKE
jgi:S-adenosylmethionine synthetase